MQEAIPPQDERRDDLPEVAAAIFEHYQEAMPAEREQFTPEKRFFLTVLCYILVEEVQNKKNEDYFFGEHWEHVALLCELADINQQFIKRLMQRIIYKGEKMGPTLFGKTKPRSKAGKRRRVRK